MTGPIAPGGLLAAVAGGLLVAGVVCAVAAWRGYHIPTLGASPTVARLSQRARAMLAGGRPSMSRREQLVRLAVAVALGGGLWLISGWPVAGIATTGILVGLPWLLGSARVAQDRIERLEALETWCRRMADTLSGGGAVGLVQAIVASARNAPEALTDEIALLARRMQGVRRDDAAALRAFAEAINDPVGDHVAAALILALHQRSTGVARVLRRLADGVAREVRGRRAVEVERAEPRQSMRMLLLIQAGVLLFLALVPNFAAPYRTPLGQIIMAVLLAGTIALLLWMRRLALGQPAPRFLRAPAGEPTR